MVPEVFVAQGRNVCLSVVVGLHMARIDTYIGRQLLEKRNKNEPYLLDVYVRSIRNPPGAHQTLLSIILYGTIVTIVR